MRQPIRAVGIVIKDKSLLLMHRINQGKEYYVFPGGGVEENETIEEAITRELREETSVEVNNLRLLYHHHIIGDANDSDQYFYLCDYVSGVPKLSEGNELAENRAGTDFYEPLWYPISKLSQTLLYPLEIRDWLLEDLEKGFSNNVKEAVIKKTELRRRFNKSNKGTPCKWL